MRICVLHRYPISEARETNPSLPLFLKELVSRRNEVIFISLKETRGVRVSGVIKKEINFTLKRTNSFDKLLKSLLFVLITPFLVRKIHKKQKLDLVYCDDSFPLYGFLIKKIAKTKTIIRLGDLQSGYAFADSSFIKTLIFKMVFGLEKKMWRSVDKVVAISQAFEDFLIKSGLSGAKIANVPECIDIEMFKPRGKKNWVRKKYRVEGLPLVMFHGLIAKMKGLQTLLKAVPKILKEKPQAKFMIIGDGQELRSLMKLVRRLKIEKSVIFTNWVPLSQLPEYLAECDVGTPLRNRNLANNFVVTSALLQYWAMEKPVVAPSLSAIRSLIKNHKNGLLFEPDNPNDLARRILYILKNPEEAKQMGIRGRITATELFSSGVVAQKMADVLLGDISSCYHQFREEFQWESKV